MAAESKTFKVLSSLIAVDLLNNPDVPVKDPQIIIVSAVDNPVSHSKDPLA
jgi:hypothetical protein